MTRETYSTIVNTTYSIESVKNTHDVLVKLKKSLLDRCDHKYPDGISSETNGWCEICKKRI